MRILLLGELSGVHQELRGGLEALGHEVVTAHDGDAYRGFGGDIRLFRAPREMNRYVGWTLEILDQLRTSPRLVGFDVAQIITPKFFHWKLQKNLLPEILKRSKVSVLVNAACSNDFNRFVRTLPYSPCAECKRYDLDNGSCIYERAEELAWERRVYALVDAVVSTHFEYASAIDTAGFAAKNHAIPLPVDMQRHRATPLEARGRIRIYYGETRHGFKGGEHIVEALRRLKEGPLGPRVEIQRTSRLGFEEYLGWLDQAHIVVDQANSFGVGMNALYAMARGRIVLTGAEPEQSLFLGVAPEDNPIINIRPDAAMIEKALTDLVENPDQLKDIADRGRAFVERVHSSHVVARQYTSLYESLLAQRNEGSRRP